MKRLLGSHPRAIGKISSLLGALALWGLVTPAWAGQMALQITAQCVPWETRLEIALEVANRGDETALNLQAQVLGLPGAKPSRLVDGLASQKSVFLDIVAPLPPGPPGRYALPLRLDFQDLAQFPFSAMSHTHYWVGQDRSNPLVIQATPLEMDERGQLQINLFNMEEQAISLDWQVYSPRELQVAATRQRVEMPPRSPRQISVEVVNLTGLGRSNYPLLVWTGYDLDGARLEKIVDVMVKLAPLPGFFQRSLPWWLLMGGLLAAWVVWSQVRSRRRT